MAAQRLALIQEVQTDEFWQDVTVPRLETVRKQIRELIKFIEKVGQKAVHTNFEDERGETMEIALPIGGGSQSFERFKEKVRHFLRPRENELALQKLRLGLGLTRDDVAAIDKMLLDANLGRADNYEAARNQGLGVFIRSLVGLDRQAAVKSFDVFLQGRALNANQLHFIAMIIDELTRTGIMEPRRLFESPFVDVAPAKLQALFDQAGASRISRILESIRQTAAEPVPASVWSPGPSAAPHEQRSA